MKKMSKAMALFASMFMVKFFFMPTSALASIDSSIYDDNNNIFAQTVMEIVRIVGGVGGAAFVLAILIISLIIIFGSISPANMRTWYIALISCIVGAFIFFGAYTLGPAIASLAP
ncbi:type IV secretory pathway VirB2 component (pilin) [Evansella vedderi]|uniref:Type IV secretory pathway VirB2 component (Pilin) n=1 Tax=Evansella vedderi TaxID=38282 RepID=A0ABT9ZWI3_9BACI|nr:hypothetical protein [Evansella vedderi]MDQ0255586.1 type IV secretory pathway VirB2 component (pilin) [Evansella vedderi]